MSFADGNLLAQMSREAGKMMDSDDDDDDDEEEEEIPCGIPLEVRSISVTCRK